MRATAEFLRRLALQRHLYAHRNLKKTLNPHLAGMNLAGPDLILNVRHFSQLLKKKKHTHKKTHNKLKQKQNTNYTRNSLGNSTLLFHHFSS